MVKLIEARRIEDMVDAELLNEVRHQLETKGYVEGTYSFLLENINPYYNHLTVTDDGCIVGHIPNTPVMYFKMDNGKLVSEPGAALIPSCIDCSNPDKVRIYNSFCKMMNKPTYRIHSVLN